jgi:hypothetical protein
VLEGLRARLTYANVVSTICLFLILGGAAAYAGNTVFKGSVPPQSVGPRQLRPDAVSGPKVEDGSLGAADIGGPVRRARKSAKASDSAHLGGAPPSAFLSSDAITPFDEAGGCGLFCDQNVHVTTVEGFSLDAECTLYAMGNAMSYTLTVNPPDPGYRVSYSYVSGNQAKNGSFHDQGQVLSVLTTADGSSQGDGAILIEDWVSISFHYSLSGNGNEMNCSTRGISIDALA